MNRLTTFLMGAAIGAALMFTSLKYHVVCADDGVHLIPKMASDLSQTYIDIRSFSVADWNEHRELAVAIVKAEKGHLLKDAAVGNLRQSVDSVLENLAAPGRRS